MEIRHIRLSGFPFRRYTWPLFGLEVQFAGDASVAVAENCRGNDGMAAEVSVKYQIFHVFRTGFGNNPAVRAPGVFDVDDRSTSPGFTAIPSAPVPPEDRISVQCHSLVRWLFPSHVSQKHNKVQSRKSFCVDILPPYAGQTPEPSLHSSPSTASPLRAVGWESCLPVVGMAMQWVAPGNRSTYSGQTGQNYCALSVSVSSPGRMWCVGTVWLP